MLTQVVDLILQLPLPDEDLIASLLYWNGLNTKFTPSKTPYDLNKRTYHRFHGCLVIPQHQPHYKSHSDTLGCKDLFTLWEDACSKSTVSFQRWYVCMKMHLVVYWASHHSQDISLPYLNHSDFCQQDGPCSCNRCALDIPTTLPHRGHLLPLTRSHEFWKSCPRH